jgi:hypothetical protein
MRAALAKLIACALFLCASRAQADPRAAQLFDDGLEALKRGDYQVACPALARSYELEPLVGALFTLAECEARAGRVLSASRHFQRFVTEVKKLPAAERQRQRERTAFAAKTIERLSAQVPTLTIVVRARLPAKTTVTLGGVVVSAEQLNKPLRLDPGEQRIVVRSADGAETSTSVVLEPSTAEKIALRLPKSLEAKTRPTPGAARPENDDPPSSMSPLRIGGIVALALGGSALTVGLAAGGVLLSRKDTIVDNCPGGVCNDEGFAAAEDVPVYNVMATAGVSIGAAAIVSGAILLGVDAATGDENEPVVRAHATGLEVRW